MTESFPWQNCQRASIHFFNFSTFLVLNMFALVCNSTESLLQPSLKNSCVVFHWVVSHFSFSSFSAAIFVVISRRFQFDPTRSCMLKFVSCLVTTLSCWTRNNLEVARQKANEALVCGKEVVGEEALVTIPHPCNSSSGAEHKNFQLFMSIPLSLPKNLLLCMRTVFLFWNTPHSVAYAK